MKSALALFILLPAFALAGAATPAPEVVYSNACTTRAQETIDTLGARASLPSDINTQVINQCACYALELKSKDQESLMAQAEDAATFNHLQLTYVETDEMTQACGKPLAYTGADATPEGIFTQACTWETLNLMGKRGIPLPPGGRQKVTSQCACYAGELKIRGESAQMAKTAHISPTSPAYQALRETYIESGILSPACGWSALAAAVPAVPAAETPPPSLPAAPTTPPSSYGGLPDATVQQAADLANAWQGRSLRVTRKSIPGEVPSRTCYDWPSIGNCSAIQKDADGTTLSSQASNCAIGGYTQEETVGNKPKGAFILLLVAGGRQLELVLDRKPSPAATTFTDIYGQTTVDLYSVPACGS